MSKVPFTDEQLKLLRDNPYTYNVTRNKLFLTREFKELFYKELMEGKPPRQILEEHGYPASILGNERIWGISAVIKREATRPEGFSEGSNPKRPEPHPESTPEEAIKHLQHEVDYLRQEVDFLKKISSIRNTRK